MGDGHRVCPDGKSEDDVRPVDVGRGAALDLRQENIRADERFAGLGIGDRPRQLADGLGRSGKREEKREEKRSREAHGKRGQVDEQAIGWRSVA